MGINIQKAGADPPLKPDQDYPAWLSQLSEPQITLTDLKRKVAARPGGEATLQEVGKGNVNSLLGVSSVIASMLSAPVTSQIALASEGLLSSLKLTRQYSQAVRWVKLENRRRIKAKNSSHGTL